MSDNNELKKFLGNFQQNWQRIIPDYVINYGEEGKVIIEVKAISNDGSVGDGKIEKRALKILNLLGLGSAKYTACKIHYIPELSNDVDKERAKSSIVIKYDDNEQMLSFSGYEGIVCKRCFEDPLMSVNVLKIFKEFKAHKKKKEEQIFRDEFKEQVRSATIRVNGAFKKAWGLSDDVLIYKAPIIIVNPKFFY